jgi:hypothetical protein
MVAGGALALAFGLLGFAAADSDRRDDVKVDSGTVQGAIIRLFKPEKIVEFKVEKILSKEGREGAVTPKQDATKKAEEPIPLREGQIVYLNVFESRIYDPSGKELKRDDKDAWFTKDQGWAALKEGKRCKIEYSGTREVAAPKDFPKDARAGGNILVYNVTALYLLEKE